MKRVIAIDPGFDAMGVAIFDVDRYNNAPDSESIGHALMNVRTVRTDTGLELVERLKILGDAIRLTKFEADVWRLYFEQPAKPGSYKRNRAVGAERMSGPMAKLYMAIGTIVDAATAIGAEVRMVPAPRQKKCDRQIVSRAIFMASPARWSHRDAMPSVDALDAIWLGAQQLSGDIAFDRSPRAVPSAGSGRDRRCAMTEKERLTVSEFVDLLLSGEIKVDYALGFDHRHFFASSVIEDLVRRCASNGSANRNLAIITERYDYWFGVAKEAAEEIGLPSDGQACELRPAIARLRAKADAYDRINTPELYDFVSAVTNEALHQRERWTVEADGGKTDADWFWLIGYLAGKALHNPPKSDMGEVDARLHRIITVAAAAANWHAAVLGAYPGMRAGIEPPRDEP